MNEDIGGDLDLDGEVLRGFSLRFKLLISTFCQKEKVISRACFLLEDVMIVMNKCGDITRCLPCKLICSVNCVLQVDLFFLECC